MQEEHPQNSGGIGWVSLLNSETGQEDQDYYWWVMTNRKLHTPIHWYQNHLGWPCTAIPCSVLKCMRFRSSSLITCVRCVRLRQIHNSEGVYATRRWPRQLRAVALQTTLQPIAASAFAVVYLPKADTSNTSYDTYVGIVNLVLFSLYVFIINIMAAVNGTDSHVHA